MRHCIILLIFYLAAPPIFGAEIREGRCFPETSREIVDFYRHGRCGDLPAGLQPKGWRDKGVFIQKDRAAVLFDFDSTQIKPEFIARLQQWGEALSQLAELRFRLEGHADMKGDERYNYRLSLQRARKLKDYLTRHYAIDPSRLEIQGLGESRPLEGLPPSPEETRRRWNRRVELVKIP